MEQAEPSVSLLLKRLLGSGEDGNKSHDQQANQDVFLSSQEPPCLLQPGHTWPTPSPTHSCLSGHAQPNSRELLQLLTVKRILDQCAETSV